MTGKQRPMWRKTSRLAPAFVSFGIYVLALCAASALASTALASSAGAQDDDPASASDGYVEILDVTYEVLPDERRIDAQRTYTVKNLKPNVYHGDGSYTYYTVTEYPLSLERDITDLVVTSNGSPLAFEVDESSDNNFYTVYDVTLPYTLYNGDSVSFEVEYSLPSYGPDEYDERRVNSAGFEVELVTCCYFEEVTSRVVVPVEFDTVPPTSNGTRNVEYVEEVLDGKRVFTFTDNEIGGTYTEVLIEAWSGTNESGNARFEAPLADATIAVIAPPDDKEWAARFSEVANAVVEQMEEFTGEEWPSDVDVTIKQAIGQVSDERLDAIGWHGPFDGTIEVPRSFTDKQVAYSFARMWFLDVPLSGRWIAEGYTLDFAARAVERAGLGVWSPRLPVGVRSLTAWSGTVTNYLRAQYVVSEIGEQVGADGLLQILTLAETDDVAFAGVGAPEAAEVPDDWRRFIDLAERRMGARRTGETMAAFAIAESQADLLEDRNEVVADYDATFGAASRAAGDGVSAPLGVRSALSNWELDTARKTLAESVELLDDREALLDRLEEFGLSTDVGALDTSIEQAASLDQLVAIRTDLQEQQTALDQIAAAESELAGGRGAMADFGLRGTDLDAQIANARDGFERGDLDLVERETSSTSAQLSGAESEGLSRLLLWIVLPVVLVIAVVGLLGLSVWRRRKRRRARQREIEQTAAALHDERAVEAPTTMAGSATYTGTGSGNPSSS